MSGLNRHYQSLVFVKWAQLLFNSPYFTEKNKWQGRNSNFLYPPSHPQMSVYTPRAYDLSVWGDGCALMFRPSCSSWLCTSCLTILSGLCSFYHFPLPLPSTSPSVWALSLWLLSGSKSLHGSQMKSNNPSPSPTTSLLPSVSAFPSIAPISFPGDSVSGLNFLSPPCLTPLHFGFSPTILLKLFLPRSLPTFQTQRASAGLPRIWLLQYLTQLLPCLSEIFLLPWLPWYCFILVFLFHLLALCFLVSITGSSP